MQMKWRIKRTEKDMQKHEKHSTLMWIQSLMQRHVSCVATDAHEEDAIARHQTHCRT